MRDYRVREPATRRPPKTFEEFTALIGRVGLTGVEILKPMGYWNVTFWGEAL